MNKPWSLDLNLHASLYTIMSLSSGYLVFVCVCVFAFMFCLFFYCGIAYYISILVSDVQNNKVFIDYIPFKVIIKY